MSAGRAVTSVAQLLGVTGQKGPAHDPPGERLIRSRKSNFSLIFACSLDPYFSIALCLNLFELLSPLDQQEATRLLTKVVDAQGREFAVSVDSVEINVKERDGRSAVFVYQGESWAGNVLLGSGSQTFGDAFH